MGADTIFLRDPRVLHDPTYQQYGSIFWNDRILDPAKEEIYNSVNGILAKAKAKNLEKVKEESAGWFSCQTWYELERYRNFLLWICWICLLLVHRFCIRGATTTL